MGGREGRREKGGGREEGGEQIIMAQTPTLSV